MARVYLVHPEGREDGIRRLCSAIGLSGFEGADTVVKANYNSADQFPASTHPDTLRYLVECLREAGAGKMTLVERSGMGDTRKVLVQTGAFQVAEDAGLSVQVLDELGAEGWERYKAPDMHWKSGVLLPKTVTGADMVVQTCCLKTHRFGGHFTMSLKNSVGLVAGKEPSGFHDYMRELHGSREQRLMIAEINGGYRTNLVVMDALEGFSNGGPETGELFSPGIMVASTDRVSTDAVGIALLRKQGSTPEVTKGRIFELEQISRAAAIGVGAKSSSEIELVALDEQSSAIANEIGQIISRG